MTPRAPSLALLVLRSRNRKLSPDGKCATTYVSLPASCPRGCPFACDGGCYAEALDRPCPRLGKVLRTPGTALAAAREEAALIRVYAGTLLPAGYPLRLHTAGDCRTVGATKLVAKACAKWPGPVWTYTHAWRTVPRDAWGAVSVLASVETEAECDQAVVRNYAPALVVERHDSHKAWYTSTNMKVIPCPAQTKGKTCTECQLCWSSYRLHREDTAIAFAVHVDTKKALITLRKGRT